MKRIFLLIAVPALLVALGFAQTPAASNNTDQSIIQGCLGGSDGNFTIAQDNTGQILKLATGSVYLKAHLGHEVKLTGHKATAALSSGAPDNSLVVTEVAMISEHCSAAAAAPAVIGSTTSETVIPPAAVAAGAAIAPAAAIATAPPEIVSTPTAAAAPDAVATPTAAVPSAPATVSAPSEPVTAPAAPAAPTVSEPGEPITPPGAVAPPIAAAVRPNTTVKASSDIDATPAVAATHSTRPSAKPRRMSPTHAAAAATSAAAAKPAETDTTPVAAEPTPAETASAPSESASTPEAATPKPAPPARAGSLGILIAFVILVLVIGALTPLFNRWRKRKFMEKTGAQNLSFTHKSSSEQNKSDKPGTPKAA